MILSRDKKALALGRTILDCMGVLEKRGRGILSIRIETLQIAGITTNRGYYRWYVTCNGRQQSEDTSNPESLFKKVLNDAEFDFLQHDLGWKNE
jgi:hypothetical protein